MLIMPFLSHNDSSLKGGKFMNFKKIEKIILADGWVLVRVCGSHYQFKKPGVEKNVVIPNHGNKDISIGVLKNLEKITGLSLRR